MSKANYPRKSLSVLGKILATLAVISILSILAAFWLGFSSPQAPSLAFIILVLIRASISLLSIEGKGRGIKKSLKKRKRNGDSLK